MAKRHLVRGVAVVAALVAAAALVRSRLGKSKKAKAFQKAAEQIKDHVVAHAKELRRLSKSSYDRIVDATVAEYRSMKTFSKQELDALAREMKESWRQVERTVKESKK